ncbi:MurR/RpiR family transcriptional regulator [Clostridium paraputrificum]|uniref:MurR/RpiR family transcriptional regulator n=1 Tax=Clostridium paraputrificum TaxID=29363 RepID=UPI00189FC485|nr:MurR/RpiR family transcriptional regulator [Clostridium paraputrificum]
MNIICEIQQKYNNFSDKEKAIADYILNQPDMIKNINITELAKIIGTYGATITRFSKKIGCDSFVEMKMKINLSSNDSDPIDSDDIFSSVYSHYNEVIERTNSIIDKSAIFNIVEEIKKANKIYLYGVGSSGLTATEMMQRLIRMGFNIHCISDSHMMIINSSIASSKDLVIGLSISGETKEVVNALKVSKRNGAKTACITSFDESSITVYSDIILKVYNTRFIGRHKFINSQFSTMYLLDLISTVLLEDKNLEEKMQITIDAIINS